TEVDIDSNLPSRGRWKPLPSIGQASGAISPGGPAFFSSLPGCSINLFYPGRGSCDSQNAEGGSQSASAPVESPKKAARKRGNFSPSRSTTLSIPSPLDSRPHMQRLPLFMLLCFLQAPQLRAADWPQWFGPQRDGVWRETGLLAKFPKGGPTITWRT